MNKNSTESLIPVFMIEHKKHCSRTECKCSQYSFQESEYQDIINEESSSEGDELRQLRNKTSSFELTPKRSNVFKILSENGMNLDNMEEEILVKRKLLHEIVKDIIELKIKDEPSCYLYIYKSFIEKYYLFRKFQSLNSISLASETNPSFYEEFLIFSFKYYIYIYIYDIEDYYQMKLNLT